MVTARRRSLRSSLLGCALLGLGLGAAPAQAAPSVYVTSGGYGPSSISQFDAGPGGELRPKVPASFATGDAAEAIVVNPAFRSVYVANLFGLTVSQFDVG